MVSDENIRSTGLVPVRVQIYQIQEPNFNTASRTATSMLVSASQVHKTTGSHYLSNQQVTEHVAGFTRNDILPPPTGWKLAAVSSRSHVNLRFSAAILDFESSSSNLPWQASTRSSSISQSIFRTFSVRLSTA